jgi:hypothetical protein
MIFTQTLNDAIFLAIKKEADKKGITVQTQIAYELGEKYADKVEKKPIKK